MMKLPSSFVLLPFFFFLHSNGQLNSAKVGFTGLDFDLLIFKNPIFALITSASSTVRNNSQKLVRKPGMINGVTCKGN